MQKPEPTKVPAFSDDDTLVTVPITVERVIDELHLVEGGTDNPVATMLHLLGNHVSREGKGQRPGLETGFGVYRARLPFGTLKIEVTTEDEGGN